MTDLAITPEAADLLFRTARTTYDWVDTPVADETLEAAWDLAKFGPTAMNVSPLRMKVLRTPEAKARLRAVLDEGNKAKIDAPPVVLVLGTDSRFHDHLDRMAPQYPGFGATLEEATDLRDSWSQVNGLVQAAYLIIALRAAGLAVGPMNGLDAAAADADFWAGTGVRTLLVLNVGYPDGTGTHYPRNPRFDFAEIAETL